MTLTAVSEEFIYSIIRAIMQPLSSSETSGSIYQTTLRNFLENNHLNIRRYNLKSHQFLAYMITRAYNKKANFTSLLIIKIA